MKFCKSCFLLGEQLFNILYWLRLLDCDFLNYTLYFINPLDNTDDFRNQAL